LKQQGQQAIEEYIRELEKQAVKWVEEQVTKQICPSSFVLLIIPLALTVLVMRKK
jgi:hypothetical protein